ncbi:fumarylacetoacetate hydrolase family protein, partial [Sulfitobacter sp.]|uniref:fumarylacetoacetate hydrolase family protein n=1 Tax=Sulfitobacter sp. TaxID=1903071 RepID=UPI003EF695B1
MSINIARFEHGNAIRWGVVTDNGLIPIDGDFPTTGSLIEEVKVGDLKNISGTPIPIDDVKLLSPVTRNQQFVCQGANYRQHMIESGMDPDAKHYNMIFTKAQSCICPADSPVIVPKHVRFLDYEIELGLVLRKAINGPVDVTDENLLDFVAGLTIVNDYSARDVQIPQMQFYKGKSYRTFGPVGPWLCLLEAEDMSQIDKLQLTLTVDGEVRQDDNTANLVFGPVETIEELAGLQDFEAGDLIATGTPAGCALTIPSPGKQKVAGLLPQAKKWELFMKAQEARPQYLKPGQTVECKIKSLDGAIDLGTQRNLVT